MEASFPRGALALYGVDTPSTIGLYPVKDVKMLSHPRPTGLFLPRKEVIHPQLPLRMPCYDFVPIAASAFVPSTGPSGICNSLDVTGGEYKTRERIHGHIADWPLLANPAS